MANLDTSHIKFFTVIDLLKYLREEKYTEVADIVKSQNICGHAFLELNELDLFKWRLTPKQRRQVLECKNAILSKNSQLQSIAKEPPVAPRYSLAPLVTNTCVLSKTSPRSSEAAFEDYVDMTQNTQKLRIDPKCIAANEEVKNWQTDTGRLKPAVMTKNIRTLFDSKDHFKNVKSALELQLALTLRGDESKRAEKGSEAYLTPADIATPCTFESNKQRRRVISEAKKIYEVESDDSKTEEHIYNEANESVRSHFPASIPCKVPNRQLKIPPPATSFNYLRQAKISGKDCNAVNGLSMSYFPRPPPFKNEFPSEQVSIAKVLLDAKEVIPGETKIMLDAETHEFPPMNSKKLNANNCRFYRNTDRKGAEELLKRIPNLSNGAFLFRHSEKFSMVITMYQEARFYNVAIKRDNNQLFSCNSREKDEVKFRTLDDFIDYYEVNPIEFRSRGVSVHVYLKKLLLDDIY